MLLCLDNEVADDDVLMRGRNHADDNCLVCCIGCVDLMLFRKSVDVVQIRFSRNLRVDCI